MPSQEKRDSLHAPRPMDSNTSRTHDAFYVNESPELPPKDMFKQVASIIKEYKRNGKQISIVDIGCAAGAFPRYLSSVFPTDKIYGLEVREDLVSAARKIGGDVEYIEGSVTDKESLNPHSYDLITMVGVIGIFDDIEPIVDNLMYWCRPGGKILMSGGFNAHGLDVFIRYRSAENYGVNVFESGWNMFSQKTVASVFKKYGARNCKFHKFSISVDLEPNESDPVRSWTEKLLDGERFLINGLSIKQDKYILEVDV